MGLIQHARYFMSLYAHLLKVFIDCWVASYRAVKVFSTQTEQFTVGNGDDVNGSKTVLHHQCDFAEEVPIFEVTDLFPGFGVDSYSAFVYEVEAVT